MELDRTNIKSELPGIKKNSNICFMNLNKIIENTNLNINKLIVNYKIHQM